MLYPTVGNHPAATLYLNNIVVRRMLVFSISSYYKGWYFVWLANPISVKFCDVLSVFYQILMKTRVVIGTPG